MLNTDACQARLKSGCIFLSLFENQFVLIMLPLLPSLNAQVPVPGEQTGPAFPRNFQGGMH